MVYWLRMSWATVAADLVYFVQASSGRNAIPPVRSAHDLQSACALAAAFLLPAIRSHRRSGHFLPAAAGLPAPAIPGSRYPRHRSPPAAPCFSSLAFFFRSSSRRHYSVVERRAAARIDLLQRFLQLLDIVGEVLVEIILVVEIDDEHFVLRIARPNQIEGGLDSPCRAFRAWSRNCRSRCPARPEYLRAGTKRIFCGLPSSNTVKCVLVEVRNHALLVIDDGGVQHDFVHLLVKHENSAFFRPGLLSADLLLRCSRRRCSGAAAVGGSVLPDRAWLDPVGRRSQRGWASKREARPQVLAL